MIQHLKRLFKKQASSQELYKDYVQIDDSTKLINGLSIRFDVGKEERKYVEIGACGLISASFIFESEKGKVVIGNNVHIGGASFISINSIIVEDDVTMAWGITVYDHDSHSIYWEHRQYDNTQCYSDYHEYNGNKVMRKNWEHVVSKPIHVCAKAWIGFDVTILKGVIIGEGAVVAAKSVVTKDVPAWTVVAGNPAKVVKELKQP